MAVSDNKHRLEFFKSGSVDFQSGHTTFHIII